MNTFSLSPEAHHYLGIEMNQQCWRLLDQPERSDREARRLEHYALASLHHWKHSPHYQPLNAQRGHWLLARVYAVLERGEDARKQAEACLLLTERLELDGFDRAYACEAMARALASLGAVDEGKTWHARALEAGEAISDEQDRSLFLADLAGGPWFSLPL